MENHPAYKYSIKILSRKDYSRAKLRKKLLDQGHHDVPEELMDLLTEKNYLRENEYIENRITGLMKKNFSPDYIVLKLKEEELFPSEDLIMSIFDSWNYSRSSQIEDLIRKKCLLHNWTPEDIKDPKNKVKLSRFIQSKGHDWLEIKELL